VKKTPCVVKVAGAGDGDSAGSNGVPVAAGALRVGSSTENGVGFGAPDGSMIWWSVADQPSRQRVAPVAGVIFPSMVVTMLMKCERVILVKGP